MAQATLVDTRLSLVLSAGIDPETGDQVYKRKSFSNVKLDATPDQLFAVATAIAPLQQLPLFKIEYREDNELNGLV